MLRQRNDAVRIKNKKEIKALVKTRDKIWDRYSDDKVQMD